MHIQNYIKNKNDGQFKAGHNEKIPDICTNVIKLSFPFPRGEGLDYLSGSKVYQKDNPNLAPSACQILNLLTLLHSLSLPSLHHAEHALGGQALHHDRKVHGNAGDDQYHLIALQRQELLRAECERQ